MHERWTEEWCGRLLTDPVGAQHCARPPALDLLLQRLQDVHHPLHVQRQPRAVVHEAVQVSDHLLCLDAAVVCDTHADAVGQGVSRAP